MKEIIMKQTTYITGAILIAILLQGCGNNGENRNSTPSIDHEKSQNEHTGKESSEGHASNIPYLRTNHANYSQHGSSMTPSPTKDSNKMSIDWTIAATTQEGAEKLQEHLQFMENKLLADENPRAWDKLFLMEAYMKYNRYYTTSVERSGTNVVVSKQANTRCAYEVISAHSDAVSGDFFAQGDIDNDYSNIAENILASSACNAVRSSLESYIISRQKRKSH